jgi:hypothetical protein
MKTKSLLFILAVSFALFSCSKDDSLEATEKGKAYMTLAVSFPEGSNELRAGTTGSEIGDGTETGLKTEQDFSNVGIAIVNSSGSVVDYFNLDYSDFTPSETSTSNSLDKPLGVKKTYMSVKKLVPSGSAYVYVFVNPTNAVNTVFAIGQNVIESGYTKKNELAELASSTEITAVGGIARDGNFLMCNSTDPIKYGTININGTSLTPTVVTVEVERAAVKLVENTSTLNFDITNSTAYYGTSIKASLTDYTYDNFNKRSFILKRKEYRNDATAHTLPSHAVTDSFVVDPNFVFGEYKSVLTTPGHWYDNDFFTKLSNSNVTFSMSGSDKRNYCYENTMIDKEQYENKTTAVIYKAQIKDASSVNMPTFYTYKNKIYTSYTLLNTAWTADYGTSVFLNTIFTEADVATAYSGTPSSIKTLNMKLLRRGIKCYYNGTAYYKWMIKHWEQSTNLARMEFALVRNNVYYLEVKAISNLGDPWVPGGQEDPQFGYDEDGDGTPENPDTPNTPGTGGITNPVINPDETSSAYIQVELKVLPWTVRFNDITF